MFKPFRASLGGIRALFEHLLRSMGLSLLWWLCIVTIIGGPPATLALFWATNPRMKLGEEAPGVYELLGYAKDHFLGAWKIALLTMPLIVLVGFNFWFYSSENGALALLSPLMLVVLTLMVAIATQIVAHASLKEDTSWSTIKAGVRLAIRYPPSLLLFGLLVCLIVYGSAFMVLPLILLVPALIAAMSVRYQIEAQGEKLFDPGTPTPERLEERARSGATGWRGRFSR